MKNSQARSAMYRDFKISTTNVKIEYSKGYKRLYVKSRSFHKGSQMARCGNVQVGNCIFYYVDIENTSIYAGRDFTTNILPFSKTIISGRLSYSIIYVGRYKVVLINVLETTEDKEDG